MVFIWCWFLHLRCRIKVHVFVLFIFRRQFQLLWSYHGGRATLLTYNHQFLSKWPTSTIPVWFDFWIWIWAMRDKWQLGSAVTCLRNEPATLGYKFVALTIVLRGWTRKEIIYIRLITLEVKEILSSASIVIMLLLLGNWTSAISVLTAACKIFATYSPT